MVGPKAAAKVTGTDVAVGVGCLQDIRSTLQRGNPEVSIKFDRDKLAALDLEADPSYPARVS